MQNSPVSFKKLNLIVDSFAIFYALISSYHVMLGIWTKSKWNYFVSYCPTYGHFYLGSVCFSFCWLLLVRSEKMKQIA
uniref:Uncharacterized protein n=1 Tax=Arundo donax TaxID=35708 RepID=A0A0A9HGW7_ARUDO